jgi:hypothetical protein
MTDARSTHFDALSHPLHAHAREPSDSSRRKRRAVVAMNPIGNAMFSEDSSKARNDTISTNRVVTIYAKHKASGIILNSQRITQRTIAKAKLSLEINGLLLVWASTCSIRTVRTPKTRVATFA